MCRQDKKPLSFLLSLFNVGRASSPELWERWYLCREIHSMAWVPLPLCPDFPLALNILDFTSTGVYPLPNLPLLQVSSCSLVCATVELVPWAIQSVFLPLGYSPCWWWSMPAAQGFDFLQVHSDLRELEKWMRGQLRVIDKCSDPQLPLLLLRK